MVPSLTCGARLQDPISRCRHILYSMIQLRSDLVRISRIIGVWVRAAIFRPLAG